VFFDQMGVILPSPYLVTEYVEGATTVDPSHLPDAISQLAAYLSRLHAVDVSNLDLDFLPRQAQRVTSLLANRPTKVDDTWDEGRIRDTLEAVWPLPQRNPSVLLHGDFWPGNVLWRNGRIAAVIDWEDAALGDPLADLANARLEILWAFGLDAMRQFTEQYQSPTTFDLTHLPYWDLYAALRPVANISTWGFDAVTEKTMRDKHRSFVAQALNEPAG
jgi:aminoglycoside phosphotransferase (APT) family kinase protein